jgi:hypothetical protein
MRPGAQAAYGPDRGRTAAGVAVEGHWWRHLEDSPSVIGLAGLGA